MQGCEVVPQRFQIDGGADVARVPQQRDHLAEDPYRNATACGVIGVERPVTAWLCQSGRNTRGAQPPFQRRAMLGGSDHDHGGIIVQPIRNERGDRGDEVVGSVVEADDVIMFVDVSARHLRNHEWTLPSRRRGARMAGARG